MGRARRPARLRRRLTAAFVAVAAFSSGALAVLTYVATSSYRWRNFESTSRKEVSVALSLAPTDLTESSFERLLRAYENRAGTDTVAMIDGQAYSSSATLTLADVPRAVRQTAPDELATVETVHRGSRRLVIGGRGPGDSQYAFFFSLEQLEASLDELKAILTVAWLFVVVTAAGAGHFVARRTLRPVREAADAANSLAGGLLQTRLTPSGDDEFADWAESFNEMADALEAQIDALSRSAERERRVTADLAHDLRTPLTAMTVTASLLEEHLHELGPDGRRAASGLIRDVVRLKALVLDLLELSRLDAGSEPVETEDLDVAKAVDATLDSLNVRERATVRMAIEPGLTVCADRARFRRIVANVVDNAVTHGGGDVLIEGARQGPDVQLVVRDRGPGIDPRHAASVFDRFYKGDESRSGGGSGLGLGIARDHARAHGGDVFLAPSSDGATVVIRLPAPPSD